MAGKKHKPPHAARDPPISTPPASDRSPARLPAALTTGILRERSNPGRWITLEVEENR